MEDPITSNSVEEAYLLGYRNGYNAGSKRGLEIANDMLTRALPPPTVAVPYVAWEDVRGTKIKPPLGQSATSANEKAPEESK